MERDNFEIKWVDCKKKVVEIEIISTSSWDKLDKVNDVDSTLFLVLGKVSEICDTIGLQWLPFNFVDRFISESLPASDRFEYILQEFNLYINDRYFEIKVFHSRKFPCTNLLSPIVAHCPSQQFMKHKFLGMKKVLNDN